VGLENPYTHYHPEAPGWDYLVFDVSKRGLEPFPISEGRRLVEGVSSVSP